MDPQSKRFVWDTIESSFKVDRGAILTTHSMEEADALCTRVGIMVKGELRYVNGNVKHVFMFSSDALVPHSTLKTSLVPDTCWKSSGKQVLPLTGMVLNQNYPESFPGLKT